MYCYNHQYVLCALSLEMCSEINSPRTDISPPMWMNSKCNFHTTFA